MSISSYKSNGTRRDQEKLVFCIFLQLGPSGPHDNHDNHEGLTDNNRLLNEDELIYRRLNNENNNLFGDKIVSLHINRPNTTLNIEKRLLEKGRIHNITFPTFLFAGS